MNLKITIIYYPNHTLQYRTEENHPLLSPFPYFTKNLEDIPNAITQRLQCTKITSQSNSP